MSGLLFKKIYKNFRIKDEKKNINYISNKLEEELKNDYSQYLFYEKEDFKDLILKYQKLFKIFLKVNEEKKKFRNLLKLF